MCLISILKLIKNKFLILFYYGKYRSVSFVNDFNKIHAA